MVRHSEPLVPEDHEQWERNHLLAEEQKWKKDTTKRNRDKNICPRDNLEKHRWQQARDGVPREESPSEPDSDDKDFDIFSDEGEEAQGFGDEVPPQGAPAGGRGLRGARCFRKKGQGSGPSAPAS
jgi:hypothetical protein